MIQFRSKTGDGNIPEQVPAATDTQFIAVLHPRSRIRQCLLAICAGIVFFGFFALGTWQVVRLQWKLNLIERVEQRVHAQPVAVPGPDRWSQVTAQSDEYRRVHLSGTFLYEQSAIVQAVTDFGNGYWLMTPLRTVDDNIVLINRGFIPTGQSRRATEFRDSTSDASGLVGITGLLRISEPHGGFLRKNDPIADRWYSRDVQAIAAARHLSNVAPYFVDAAARPTGAAVKGSTDYPVGGLTVIAFHNNHLVYALTWYALALMVAGACFWVVREQKKSLHAAGVDRIDRESEDGKQN